MTHQQKVNLANRLLTRKERQETRINSKVKLPATGKFSSKAWEQRRKDKATKVANRIKKIRDNAKTRKSSKRVN